ncbi:MAG: oxidative damage protection protein [Gammaproteobacteria bacterium]|nr:oxidative damage protection protein [Gammaproteobacteria bacterium]
MARMVQCVVTHQQGEGLDAVPHPGELGQRIYEHVSKAGWQQWLERLTTIINENGLSTADPASIAVIEDHMRGFFFKEGELGNLPEGFQPPGARK